MRLKKKAVAGDGNAAWTLFMHYGLGLRDEKTAERWLQLAYRLGEPNAQRYIKVRRAAHGESSTTP